jgi:hypothetical protein
MCGLLLCIHTPAKGVPTEPTAGAQSMEPKFVFFPKNRSCPTSPYLHPKLGESNVHGVFLYVISVPFQGDLCVFLCYAADNETSDEWRQRGFFDAPNSNSKLELR